LILNNFKKLVSVILVRVKGGEQLYRDSAKKLFKTWQGEVVSYRFNQDDNDYNGSSNLPQATFVGSYSLCDFTIALPELENEEAFLENKKFLYSGKNYTSKNYGVGQNYTNASPPVGLYMILGSGDTPPTPDDYKLDNWIPTTELSVQNYYGTGPILESPPSYMLSITTSYKNNTNENITVKEIGIARSFLLPFKSENTTNYEIRHILLVRDVLQNPVIIKPGEITSFTIVIK
jgi:hypothetical protein